MKNEEAIKAKSILSNIPYWKPLIEKNLPDEIYAKILPLVHNLSSSGYIGIEAVEKLKRLMYSSNSEIIKAFKELNEKA